MPNRSELLSSIATTIADYRQGELSSPTPEHIDRWISQFRRDVQIPMLEELDHVFKSTYFNQAYILHFLDNVIRFEKIAGANPVAYWKSVNFLDIQVNGESQHTMLRLLNGRLEDQLGISINSCGSSGGDFLYIDDIMFTGMHVGKDLETWILKDAPEEARLHIILIAYHKFARYRANQRLDSAISSSRKKIEKHYWRLRGIENRKEHKKDAEVLWPSVLPDEQLVKEYLELPHKFPFEIRPTGGKLGPFSTEEGRQLLEREFLLAGVKIRSLCKNPSDMMRPLGYSHFGLGFGSMIVTYRNCPNNCPLALWWGDPKEDISSPLSSWYPLLMRKTYT